ncbi:MAG: hypothetical protein O3C17_26765 [Planctomycetota bacterium]|nr:hypothetical protein [Planctomycetota bacterium]
MTLRRLPKEIIGDRGLAIYQRKLRTLLEPQDRGRFVAIDVETEDYEVAEEAHEASDRLRERHPHAQVLVERIGYPVAFHATQIQGFF